MVRKCKGRPPLYGSAEMFTYPEGSPEWIAAVVVAAGAWAADQDNLPANLAYELEQTARGVKRLADTEYVENARAHRRQWGQLRLVPPRDDLEARVARAREPRPGDVRPARGGDQDAV